MSDTRAQTFWTGENQGNLQKALLVLFPQDNQLVQFIGQVAGLDVTRLDTSTLRNMAFSLITEARSSLGPQGLDVLLWRALASAPMNPTLTDLARHRLGLGSGDPQRVGALVRVAFRAISNDQGLRRLIVDHAREFTRAFAVRDVELPPDVWDASSTWRAAETLGALADLPPRSALGDCLPLGVFLAWIASRPGAPSEFAATWSTQLDPNEWSRFLGVATKSTATKPAVSPAVPHVTLAAPVVASALPAEPRGGASVGRQITILHVSDVQFGRNHRFGRLALGGADEKFDTLLQRLCDDLDELGRSHGVAPDLVALTGDLAEWGKKKEFDDVLAFCEGLRAKLSLGRDRVLVVPGNHDINRSRCDAYFKSCEADDAQPVPPCWPKWEDYVGFFKALYKGVDRYRFTPEEPWTLYELPELKVVVAGLNSTMHESHRDQDHHGWVGEGQLRWFRDKLREYEKAAWLRVGMVHHNVLRRAKDDDENLRDVDDLREILADHLNLLLHGHTHDGRSEALGLSLPVISTGSAAVKGEQRPEEAPNQYQVIRVRENGFWCGARQYTPQRKKWIGDTRVSRQGDAWQYEKKVPFERVSATFAAPVTTAGEHP